MLKDSEQHFDHDPLPSHNDNKHIHYALCDVFDYLVM